jgi:XRE family transcriptional regulator, regulator of sulfur utilization
MPADEHHICRNIRTLRKRRGLSLTELSRLTGVAASNLSSIELGKTSPTVSTLTKIAAAFNVRPGSLLDGEINPRAFLCRRNEGAAAKSPVPGVSVHCLSSDDPAMDLDCRLIRLEAGTGQLHLTGEETERLVHCVEGELGASVAGETYTMAPGDTLHAKGPFELANRGRDMVSILVMEVCVKEATG